MKQIRTEQITRAVKEMCIEAACDLPVEVEKLIKEALEKEESEFGKYSLEKIDKNVAVARKDNVPMCQDTGITVVFIDIGQDVHIIGGPLQDAVNEGVRRGYKEGYLRNSVVKDPVFERVNTGDNTPALIHTEIVPGDTVKIQILPKGAGSENMGFLKMLKPAEGVEGIKKFVVESLAKAGGNPCPPVIVGVGIGGTMDKSAYLSKRALTRTAGAPNPDPEYRQLEEELLEHINKLGIGPQGFGGKVTALAVHIEAYATHIATMPVAVNLNCHAARHKEVILKGERRDDYVKS